MTTAPPEPVVQQVASLMRQARREYHGTVWGDRLRVAEASLDGPLQVALAGRVNAGKSTLLNAMVGDCVAPTDAGECTRVVTWYRQGQQVGAWAVTRTREVRPVPTRRTAGRLMVDLDGWRVADLSRVEVELDNASLRDLVFIDTPGMGSTTTSLGDSTRRFLVGDDLDAEAPDAVVYLMRQLHITDADFLEAFRDPSAQGVPPVNAIGLIARADETGGGREDALQLAAAIATRHAQEPRLRPYVQTVLPIAGLMAEAAATLPLSAYADLLAMAAVAPSVTTALLLSADRWTAPRRYLPVPPERRRDLADRLGIFGVRWAIAELRAGTVQDHASLCRRLAEVSGITTLKDVLRTQLIDRRDVLKADGALRLLTRAVASQPTSAGAHLRAEAERLRLGMHDFAELRLLNDLRLGLVEVGDDDRVRMEALLGARGSAVWTRLGLSAADVAPLLDLEQEVLKEHAHWQSLAVDPTTAPTLSRAAAVVQRTLVRMRREVRSAAEPRG